MEEKKKKKKGKEETNGQDWENGPAAAVLKNNRRNAQERLSGKREVLRLTEEKSWGQPEGREEGGRGQTQQITQIYAMYSVCKKVFISV